LLVKTPRVYVDTSVIGGCFDAEFERWSNALVSDFEAGRLVPVVSVVVATEVEVAPEQVRAKYQEMRLLGAEILEVNQAALEVVGGYSKHEILPPRFRNDMLHIALATVADVDVLVSWNFKHIVRFDKIRRYNAVNLELGYRSLQIRSPREVAYDEG
jgi:predicted nucleic acid-binding protein